MTKLTWSELTLPPINLWSLPNNRNTFVKTKTEDLVEALYALNMDLYRHQGMANTTIYEAAQRLGDDRAIIAHLMTVLGEALLCVPASQRDVFENIINKIKEI